MERLCSCAVFFDGVIGGGGFRKGSCRSYRNDYRWFWRDLSENIPLDEDEECMRRFSRAAEVAAGRAETFLKTWVSRSPTRDDMLSRVEF